MRNDVTAAAWKSILKGANYDGFVCGTKIYTKRGTKAKATTDFYALKPTQVDIRVSIEKRIYLFILFVFCVELTAMTMRGHCPPFWWFLIQRLLTTTLNINYTIISFFTVCDSYAGFGGS